MSETDEGPKFEVFRILNPELQATPFLHGTRLTVRPSDKRGKPSRHRSSG